MTKIKRNVSLTEEQFKAVSKLAHDEHKGNFTAAVDVLLAQALAMRKVPKQVRFSMYDQAESYENRIKSIDGRHPNCNVTQSALIGLNL